MNFADQINPAEQVERIREILVGRDMELVNQRVQSLETQLQSQSELNSNKLGKKLEQVEHQFTTSQKNMQSVANHIRQQLQQEATTRGQQIGELAQKIDTAAKRMDQTSQQLLNIDTKQNEGISKQIESLSSEMAARIDAHSRQIMEHMHREIQQWKSRMDEQINSLSEDKLDKHELTTRLARIASAAMGDAVPPNTHPASSTSPSGMGSILESSMGGPFGGGTTAPLSQTAEEVPNFSSLDVFAMPSEGSDFQNS